MMTLQNAIEGLRIALDEHDRECDFQASVEGENTELWDEIDVNADAVRVVLAALDSAPDMLAALKRAEQFMTNGIELRYIRMPQIPDPALETASIVRAAIKKAEGK